MIFSLLLLFGFGFNTVNAQYVSEQEAITTLTQEVISLDDKMQSLTGNTAEVEKAEFKIKVLKSMVEKIEEGNNVKQTIDMTIGVTNSTSTIGGTSNLAANQLSRAKDGRYNWLIDDILEMLTL